MKIKGCLFFAILLGQCCTAQDLIIPSGMTVCDRFQTPGNYERVEVDDGSFGAYLRNLPLKDDGSEVFYYDGKVKPNRDIYDAVVDLPIGERDLHQCADAVMRLRGEYLWHEQRYNDIHFNFTNGMKVSYKKWMSGSRISVQGNETSWKASRAPSNSYEDFWSYMEMVFAYAGTASLEKEVKTVAWEEMEIGDMLIQGGHPGHVVLVVDMAIDENTGRKAYLLGQSYMPAQEFQILKNPLEDNSPWYYLDAEEAVKTPEWTFSKSDLKRF